MKKIIVLSLILTSVVMLSMTSCKKDDSGSQIIKYDISSDVISLDPQIAEDASAKTLAINMYEGLFRLDENGELRQGAATSFDSNSDFTTFIFHLRPEATWTDEKNTEVVADDFVFGFQRGVQIGANHDLLIIKNAKEVLNGTKSIHELGVKSVDKYTFQVDLEYSCSDFPKLTADTSLMPCNRHFFEESNNQYGMLYKKTICNGPFRLKNRYAKNPGKSIELKSNPNYNGSNKPKAAGIFFNIVKPSSNPIERLKAKDTDACIINYDILETDRNILNIVSSESYPLGFCFNLENNEMNNLDIRRAFLCSLNRNYLSSNINEEKFNIERNMINKDIKIDGGSYRNKLGKDIYINEEPNTIDILKAGLEEISQDNIPKVTVLCPDDQTSKDIVSKALETWNKRFNSYFNMRPLPINKLKAQVMQGNYKIAFCPIIPASDNIFDFLSMFKTDHPENIFHLKDEQYDNLINSIIDLHGNERLSKCEEAENYIISNAMFYPVCSENKYFVTSKNIEGLVFYKYLDCVDFSNAIKHKNR